MPAAERARRIARNEARFRDVNDRLSADIAQVVTAPDDEVAFVCECGSAVCTEPIALDLREYAGIRRDPLCFVVKPGHEIIDVERVVERRERFFVVRKPESSPTS